MESNDKEQPPPSKLNALDIMERLNDNDNEEEKNAEVESIVLLSSESTASSSSNPDGNIIRSSSSSSPLNHQHDGQVISINKDNIKQNQPQQPQSCFPKKSQHEQVESKFQGKHWHNDEDNDNKQLIEEENSEEICHTKSETNLWTNKKMNENSNNDDARLSLELECTEKNVQISEGLSKRRLYLERKQQRRKERNLYRKRTYWEALPIDILETIFKLLSIKDRHVASQVCPHWFESFYSPSIWTTFVLTDTSFTKRKFNYYLGYQRIIDPFKTQIYLQKFGHNIRRLIIKPMTNFFNLYEFMKILSQFSMHYEPNPLRNLKRFDFTFCCRSSNSIIIHQQHFDEPHRRISIGDIERDIIGTGGKLLEALKELMSQLIGLRHLALRDLLLNVQESRNLLDNIAINCHEQLQTLILINCTKNTSAFLHTGVFINLEILVISHQHLDENVLELLSFNSNLRHLYLIQTELTQTAGPLPETWWRNFHKINTKTKIHLVMANKSASGNNTLNQELALQKARVNSIIYDAPNIRPTSARLIDVAQQYFETLECVAFYNLPKFSIRKSYVDRVDSLLIFISQQCPRLRTIIINDLISTSTLLLMVTHARHLTRLLVRRNAIRKRFDFPVHPEWRENFIDWLRRTSRSYEQTFREVSRMLGYQWQPLSDDQFKRIRPDVEFFS